MKKKILMLGGSYFQIPAIKYAREAGYHVISADYLPNNPGHKFAHEYHNVSTVDSEKVLELAKKLKIDGIISYASDPGAPTSAYVSEKLGLPGNPFQSVKILQRKDLFRKFLKNNGFNVPESSFFVCVNEAREYACSLLKKYFVIVKPVDSSGSKGVTRLENIEKFNDAFEYAMRYSISKGVVVEQFIERNTYEMDGDGFVWNGKLAFRCFGNQHNDLECNAYVPAGISFPYVQKKELQMKAHNIIEKILEKLNMKVGGLNIEYLTDDKDNIYILEIGPRSGGNLIPEVIKYATDVDLIAYSVEGALGKDCSDLKYVEPNGYYSSYILHSQKNGILREIRIAEELNENIINKSIWIMPGDEVRKFNGSNETIGTMILKFQSETEMMHKVDNMNQFINIDVS